MNTEFPTDPRKALEASLTALLLGELPDEQARFLRQAIATDPELAKTFESLKKTIELVRETESNPVPIPAAVEDAPKLSDARRERLLGQFKTIRPAQFQEPARRKSSWLFPIAASGALLFVLASLLVRPFSKAAPRSLAQRNLGELDQLHSLTSANAIAPRFKLEDGELAKRQRELGRQPGENSIALNETLARHYVNSSPTPESSPAPLPGAIALPPETKPESTQLSLSGVSDEKKDDGFWSRSSTVVGGDLALGTSPVLEAQKSMAGANERIPVLGDVPVVGKMFQQESPPSNAPELAGNNKEWSLQSDLRGFSDGEQASWIGSLEKSPRSTTASDKTQPGVTQTPEPQQAATLSSGGGGIGRDALGVPSAYAEAQQLTTNGAFSVTPPEPNSLNIFGYATVNSPRTFDKDGKSIPSMTSGVPESSVVQNSDAAPTVTPLPGTRFGVLPSTQTEGEKLPDPEAGRTVALAGLDNFKKQVLVTKEAAESTTLDDFTGSKRVHTLAQASTGQGAYYGGGTFGGYSTLAPTTLKPGQQPLTIAIQGVGEVPVLNTERVDDGLKASVQKEPVAALPEVKAKAGEVADAAAGRKAGLAELDTKKTELAQRREAEEGQSDLRRSKGERTDQSKSLALASRDGDRREQEDLGAAKQATSAPELQPEIKATDNPFSTFSLNVSDVSFKLAAASLEKGVLPDPAGIRSEEFINAFDYRDPESAAGAPVAFACERAAWPFAQNRDVLRFSIKTAAAGRQPGRPLNIVLLLDNSGSMERADRVKIIHEALRVLAAQLGKQDTVSVVTFARTARLWVDGIPGDQAGAVADELSSLTPQGGTNLEEAMNLAYQTALRHYSANGMNRVVLLTDGAANLGDTNPEALKNKVETNRKQGIALDCFGIGWEGYNDDLLEVLTRNGDGRYGFLNTPEEAASSFADQLAGALHVAANDVKVQVEFNTNRVSVYRQIGYAHHQLIKEQFRDNKVNAAAMGAAESGNALYVIETDPKGEGPLAIVRIRYRIPGTGEYREQEWTVPFTGAATALPQTSPAMRLAATTGAFSEWLASSPYAADVTPDRLLGFLNGVPSIYGADPRPQQLEWMIRQAKALSGK